MNGDYNHNGFMVTKFIAEQVSTRVKDLTI